MNSRTPGGRLAEGVVRLVGFSFGELGLFELKSSFAIIATTMVAAAPMTATISAGLDCFFGILPNVKDEPRRDLARLVRHHDSHSVVSFREHIPKHEA